MRNFGHLITLGCLLSFLWASAAEQASTKPKPAREQRRLNRELKPLQGTWEGELVGDQAHQKLTVTVTGNSLHFHRDTNFWFDTTITLPAGKDPKQLHATIKDCPASQSSSIGQVVKAFFKVQGATLILAIVDDGAEETAKGFESSSTRYELRRVRTE
jgi:uncharacterized protein (TIGR03067 family)